MPLVRPAWTFEGLEEAESRGMVVRAALVVGARLGMMFPPVKVAEQVGSMVFAHPPLSSLRVDDGGGVHRHDGAWPRRRAEVAPLDTARIRKVTIAGRRAQCV
jgi:hypothetical protein